MSVISISELTLGNLTLPAASAAGLPGSCLTRNADGSGLILPSVTVLASSVRSSAEENVGTLRRPLSPQGPDIFLCARPHAGCQYRDTRQDQARSVGVSRQARPRQSR